jgi:hypothetical protein
MSLFVEEQQIFPFYLIGLKFLQRETLQLALLFQQVLSPLLIILGASFHLFIQIIHLQTSKHQGSQICCYYRTYQPSSQI